MLPAVGIFDSFAEPVISEVSGQLHMSRRKLEIAFKEITSVSPRKFFHNRKMTRVYQSLLKAGPRECSVTRLADQAEFLELGRFAVQYRRLFGEKPSDTLRRRNPETSWQVGFQPLPACSSDAVGNSNDP